MELKHVIARDKKTATMLLYGAIGQKIDGDYFAQEINYLSKTVDEITIRINSEGGNVLQGLSIFNAILNSEAYVVAQIDGVAASMAGVIPMAADRIRMNDFARIMIHDPFLPGKQNQLTAKEKKMIANLKGILSSCLTRRGMETEKMDKLMSDETWFTAQDALDAKLIDEIITTGKATAVESSLSGIAASLITPELFTNFLTTQQTSKMEAIAKLFGLSATATEADVTNEIKALQLENTALKAKATQAEASLAELNAKLAEQQKNEIEAIATQAIASGFFDESQRTALVEMGTNSFDTFKRMIEGLKKPAAASLSATIAATQSSAGNADRLTDGQTFEKMRREEPQALAEMKIAEPERFNKLYQAWEKENA